MAQAILKNAVLGLNTSQNNFHGIWFLGSTFGAARKVTPSPYCLIKNLFEHLALGLWNQLLSFFFFFWLAPDPFWPTMKRKIDCRNPGTFIRPDLCFLHGFASSMAARRGGGHPDSGGLWSGIHRKTKGFSLRHFQLLLCHLYQPASSRIKKSSVVPVSLSVLSQDWMLEETFKIT